MPDTVLLRGKEGSEVTRLQRRLSRAGFHTRADGMFGPATEAALRAFQCAAGIAVDGIAGPQTIQALAAGILAEPSIEDLNIAGHGLAARTLRIALGELKAGAREVGGNNRGEWVRKYMGAEGLPWCVGFATWCYRRACDELSLQPVITERWSSSRLVREARGLNLAVDPVKCTPDVLADIRPGQFFVVRGGPTGYSHTGIIRSLGWGSSTAGSSGATMQYITTVEGNTRLQGEAAPDRVVTRYRGTAALVFVAY